MLESIDEKISVVMIFSQKNNKAYPYKMLWRQSEIIFSEITYHHLVREGRVVSHIFHATDNTNDYKLILDTQTLNWKLIEVSDGNP